VGLLPLDLILLSCWIIWLNTRPAASAGLVISLVLLQAL
jgi:hypothetical protein